MKGIIIVLSILFSSVSSIAQECSYYHKKNCIDKEEERMTYDSQSKSATLGKGQISEFHMVAYKGLDYRISICNEPQLGDQVQFRIYEKNRVLIKKEEKKVEEKQEEETDDEEYSDDEEDYDEDSYEEDSYEEETVVKKNTGPKHRIVKELLYDNKDDGFNNKLEFTAEGAMSLIIEVIVPGSASTSKLKVRELGCVGVMIEHKKSKKVGF